MKKIVFLVGESGCGKTHLQDSLISMSNSYTRIISTTTRMPREGEEDGRAYHFMWSKTFVDKKINGEFLQDVLFGGNYYGTQLIEYYQKQDTGIFVCTPEGILDTINGLKARGIKMKFHIIFFLATLKLLRDHGVSEERILRGAITSKFINDYYHNAFDGIPIDVITADIINDKLPGWVDSLVSL